MRTTTHYQITVVGNRRNLMPLEDVASHADLHPDLVRRFTEFGLLEPAEVSGGTMLFDPEVIHRIEVIQRLRCDLGINLAGIGVILELLDRFNPRP
jgi:MerR family transcriptional regulator, heat shock protein HspR